MNTQEIIKKVLWENGMFDVLGKDLQEISENDMKEAFITADSLSMISIIMGLEHELGVAIPDDLLDPETFTWENFCVALSKVIEGKV